MVWFGFDEYAFGANIARPTGVQSWPNFAWKRLFTAKIGLPLFEKLLGMLKLSYFY